MEAINYFNIFIICWIKKNRINHANYLYSLFAATSTRLYSNSPHSTPLSELAADIKPNGLDQIVPPSNNPSDPIGVSPRVTKLVDDLLQLTVAEMIAFGKLGLHRI